MNTILNECETMESPELVEEANQVYNQVMAESVIDFPQAPTGPIAKKQTKPRKPKAKVTDDLAASLPLPPTDPIVLPSSVPAKKQTKPRKPRAPKQTPEEKAAAAEAKKAEKAAAKEAKVAEKEAKITDCP